MKVLFKLWLSIEILKIFIILIALLPYEKNTLTILLMLSLIGLTILSFYKTLPELKRLTNFILIEEEYKNRVFLCRSKNILIISMALDLLPMFPLIQAIFKYYYYKLSKSIDEVIREISLKFVDVY